MKSWKTRFNKYQKLLLGAISYFGGYEWDNILETLNEYHLNVAFDNLNNNDDTLHLYDCFVAENAYWYIADYGLANGLPAFCECAIVCRGILIKDLISITKDKVWLPKDNYWRNEE